MNRSVQRYVLSIHHSAIWTYSCITQGCNSIINTFILESLMVFSGMISAWMRGDPHFTTMDGLTYTFNGRGEFVLLKTENVELQVRLTYTHFLLRSVHTWQWRIQDFPQGGAPTPKSAIIFQIFSQKLHENERIWTPGGASLAPPLDPPMLDVCVWVTIKV